ncbi:MAG: hypothetical protein PHG66_06800 [Candidatus Colwellbacteria bacterium]|nr:hypothetical protein [Candidatus Colwellbacteria bacterium]
MVEIKFKLSSKTAREWKYYLGGRFNARKGSGLKKLIETLVKEAVADEAYKEVVKAIEPKKRGNNQDDPGQKGKDISAA